MSQHATVILEQLVERYPVLSACRSDMEKAFGVLSECFTNGGKALVCGNGGSAADAEHIVGELMKGFTLSRPLTTKERKALQASFPEDNEYLSSRLQRALPAISLSSQSALMTAVSNDTAADMAFAQQVFGYGREGDVLIALSTSGNAANVVNAAKVAKSFGLVSIGITGAAGGKLSDVCDISIKVPETETYKVQELMLPIYHALCLMLEQAFFGS